MKLYTTVLFIVLAPVIAVAQRSSTQLSAPQPMMSGSRSSSFAPERTSSFSSEPRVQQTVSHDWSMQSSPELSIQPTLNQGRGTQFASEHSDRPTLSQEFSSLSASGPQAQQVGNNLSILPSGHDFISSSDRSKFVDDALNEEDNEIRHFQEQQRSERESQIKSMETASYFAQNQPSRVDPGQFPPQPIGGNGSTSPTILDFVTPKSTDEKSRMTPECQDNFNVICYIWKQRFESEREIRSQGILCQWDSLRHLNHLKVPY